MKPSRFDFHQWIWWQKSRDMVLDHVSKSRAYVQIVKTNRHALQANQMPNCFSFDDLI
jgi:hypothetical protein